MSRRFRTRYLVMDNLDDAMLSLALKDAFPNVLFLETGKLLREPRLRTAPTIPECNPTVVAIWFPEAGWEPDFVYDESPPASYTIANAPETTIHYVRTAWFFGGGPHHWSFSLPTPEQGAFSARLRDSPTQSHKAVLNGVWRILRRLASNKLKGGLSRDRYVSTKDVSGEINWAGTSVMSWCREDPDRMIMGCRFPCDDWTPPDDPWFLDLKARALERFGDGIAGPPKTSPPNVKNTISRTNEPLAARLPGG